MTFSSSELKIFLAYTKLPTANETALDTLTKKSTNVIPIRVIMNEFFIKNMVSSLTYEFIHKS